MYGTMSAGEGFRSFHPSHARNQPEITEVVRRFARNGASRCRTAVNDCDNPSDERRTRMKREHKIGIAVTCTFLCLAGAVIGLKMQEQQVQEQPAPLPPDPTLAQAMLPPEEPPAP